MRRLLIVALLPLTGCTVDLNTKGICLDDRAQAYVGQVYGDGIARRIRMQSRAEKLRAIRPGDVVTMEFKSRRVNVAVDENNRVSRIYCG